MRSSTPQKTDPLPSFDAAPDRLRRAAPERVLSAFFRPEAEQMDVICIFPKPHLTRQTLCPPYLHGRHPYRESNCCRLQQTTFERRLQPRAEHATCESPMWSPGVRVESRRPKAGPWRPQASIPPLSKSFVLRQNVCK